MIPNKIGFIGQVLTIGCNMNERIEHNKKKYGDEIKSLESIISSDVRSSIPPNQFTSDMLVALKSGRKITPKMEHYISKIVTDNKSLDPKDRSNRLKWLESIMPKIMMVINLVGETNWSGNYKQNKLTFLFLSIHKYELGKGVKSESFPLIFKSHAMFSLALTNCKSTFFLFNILIIFLIFDE